MSGYDFDFGTGNNTKAYAGVGIAIGVLILLLIVAVVIAAGIHFMGWFRQKLPGEACSEATDCGEGLTCQSEKCTVPAAQTTSCGPEANAVNCTDYCPNCLINNPDNLPSSTTAYVQETDTDYPGNDLYYISNQTLDNMKKICDADPRCLGFNSEGWFKSSMATKEAKPGFISHKKP